MVVVLPEPLTPTTRITNGFLLASIGSGRATGVERALDLGREDALDLVGTDPRSYRPRATASRMRVAALSPRSAWMRMSSRSSREAASSLRLVKMSASPRGCSMTSARGPTEAAEASFASVPKERAQRCRAGPRPAATASRAIGAGDSSGRRGRYARAAEPAAQEAGFRFLLVVIVQRGKPRDAALCGSGRVGIPMSP